MNTEFYKKLGTTLRTTRTERNISIDTLAAVVNITPEKLSEYESGTTAMPASIFIPILQFMNFPPEFNTLM